MRFYGSISRVDAEQRMVWGYASTIDADCADGQIITRGALENAVDDYMRFANIREMHQPSAVGVAREASVDDGGLYIGAYVQDDVAWKKVTAGVYKGFSIGAKATDRDPQDRKVVRGINLIEISLVDRPADPGAVFDVWRAEVLDDVERRDFSQSQREKMAQSGEAMSDGSFPIANRADLENAIRAYGRAKNKRAVRRHIMKRAKALGAEDLIPEDWKEMRRTEEADAQSDATNGGAAAIERSAVDQAQQAEQSLPEGTQTEPPQEDDVVAPDTPSDGTPPDRGGVVRAALAAASEAITQVEAKAGARKIDLPDADIRRGIPSVGRLGWLLSELAYAVADAQFESDVEGDNSPVPGKLRAALLALGAAYKAMSDEELAELLNGCDVDVQLENGVIQLAAAGAEIKRSLAANIERSQVVDDKANAAIERARSILDCITPPVIADHAEDGLQRTVTVLQEENAKLAGLLDETAQAVRGLAERVQRLGEMPAPAKTATAAATVPVSKEQDGGHSAVAPSDNDVARYLSTLPAEERSGLLMKAALSRPISLS